MPTEEPTEKPTVKPTRKPTPNITTQPTRKPTGPPTDAPTTTESPTSAPTATGEPTPAATRRPSKPPTKSPTNATTKKPTVAPTEEPTEESTEEATAAPSEETPAPTCAACKKKAAPKKKNNVTSKGPTRAPTARNISVCEGCDGGGTKKPSESPTGSLEAPAGFFFVGDGMCRTKKGHYSASCKVLGVNTSKECAQLCADDRQCTSYDMGDTACTRLYFVVKNVSNVKNRKKYANCTGGNDQGVPKATELETGADGTEIAPEKEQQCFQRKDAEKYDYRDTKIRIEQMLGDKFSPSAAAWNKDYNVPRSDNFDTANKSALKRLKTLDTAKKVLKNLTKLNVSD
jgi:hypothetical protein